MVVEMAGIEAFCMSDDTSIIVCFRGTDSRPDRLADAMASKTTMSYEHVQVHTGFLRTLMVIEQDVFNYCIDRLAGGTRKLYITGHSLGAAMAVLFSMRWLLDSVSGVVTFGCPRVGNRVFADMFNKKHGMHSLRFVNNNDAVTKMPFEWMGYAHVYHQQYFDRKGKLHVNYHPVRVWKTWDAFAGILRNWTRLRMGDGIKDHSISDYRKLLEKI